MTKILIIDDESGFVSLIKKNLELIGDYEVTGAATGKEGLRLAEKESPALILLDITMPVHDGLTILAELKKRQATRFIPVIMLTARADNEARAKAIDLHSDGYVTKPFGVWELEEKMSEVLCACEKVG